MEKELRDAYFNLKESNVAYTSASKLIEKFKDKYTVDAIREFIFRNETPALHFPARRKWKRNFYFCNFVWQFCNVDTAEYLSIKKYNDNYAYIVSAVDCLSKYAVVEFAKTKSSEEISNCLARIVEKINMPIQYISSDAGTEYRGKCEENVYKKFNIKHIILRDNAVKNSQAERFIKTWKSVLHKYFTETNSHRWIDVLQTIVENYNNTVHSATKFAPVDVLHSKEIQKKVFRNLFGKKLMEKFNKPKYHVGQLVRISLFKIGTFTKGVDQNYSVEIYKINKIINKRIPMYKLVSLRNSPIDGSFYESELIPAFESNYYKIEKVLKTKGSGKSKLALVRWAGYHKEHDSWIKFSEVKNLL